MLLSTTINFNGLREYQFIYKHDRFRFIIELSNKADWRHKLAQNKSVRGLKIFLRQSPWATLPPLFFVLLKIGYPSRIYKCSTSL